jgi:hypothetical protein
LSENQQLPLKNMKLQPSLFLILFFVINPYLIRGQVAISGRIFSAVDSLPLSLTSVRFKNNPTMAISDLNGAFVVSGAELNDTLALEHIAYKALMMPVNEVIKENRKMFFLHPESHTLPEVIISEKTGKTYSLGKVSGKVSGFQYNTQSSFFEIIRYFPLEEHAGKLVKLKKIKYFIAKEGKFNAPFGIKVYGLDILGNPGEEILSKKLIAQAQKKNSWAVVNLDSLNIYLSGTGILAGMEWLPIYPEYVFEDRHGQFGKNCYGQVLGLTSELKQNDYFVRNLHGKWVKPSFQKVLNPMIFIEVEVFDK